MIWISLTVMIITIALSAVSLRSWRGDALGIPLIAIGTFTFLYVIQPLQLLRGGTYSLFLTDWQMAKAILLPAPMLVCFVWGWLHPRQTKHQIVKPWGSERIWLAGFAAACVGLAFYLFFLWQSGGLVHSYSEAHGGAMAFNTSTAYVYNGPLWMLSGSVMMFLYRPMHKHEKWKVAAPYIFLSIFLVDAILTGGRGGLFSATTTYFVGNSIARRSRVSFWQAARLLVPVGIGVVLMVGYRSFIHFGAKTSQDLPSVESAYSATADISEYDQEHDTSGQEFLCHAVTLDTVDQTGKLDYGIGWIEFLVINPIPRLLWPEKAMPPPIGVTTTDIREHTSLVIAPGSAAGIVADLYQRFYFFSLLFFFILGVGFRWLFIAARNLSSPFTVVMYVMLYALSLNMFAQGFAAIFVSFGYSMIPVAVYSWATQGSRRKAELRQRAAILQHSAMLNGAQWLSSRS